MIRRALFWTFLAQFTSFAIMFLGSVVIARLLSPREMGVYAVSIATIGILQIVSAFGVGNYVVRATELKAHTLDTAFTVNAAIGLALGTAIFAFSFVGGQFLGEPAVANVMRLLALAPIISIFDFRPSTMLQRDMQFKRISLVGTTQSLVSVFVTIGAALAGESYLSPAIGGVASSVVGMVGYSLAGRQHLSIRLSTTEWKPMAHFGLRMMSIGGVSALTSRLSEIIVGRLLGLAALGLFGRANNLSMLIFQNVYGTATRVIFARMSEVYRKTGQLRDIYLQGMRFITALMGPILIGLAILSRPVVHLLYGEKWLEAALPLSLLLIAQFITLRYAMNWELFVIKDELRIQTRIEFARAFFGLATRSIASLFSVVAVAAAAIVDGIFAIALYGRHINRLIDASEREMMRLSSEALLLTVAAVAPSFVLMLLSNWDAKTPLPLVGLAIVLGIALWLWVLVWRKHPLLDELTRAIAIVRQRVRKAPVARPDFAAPAGPADERRE